MEFLGFQVNLVCFAEFTYHQITFHSHRDMPSPGKASDHTGHLTRVISLLAALIQAIFPTLLRYCTLQSLKITHLRDGTPYSDWVTVNMEARDELH